MHSSRCSGNEVVAGNIHAGKRPTTECGGIGLPWRHTVEYSIHTMDEGSEKTNVMHVSYLVDSV